MATFLIPSVSPLNVSIRLSPTNKLPQKKITLIESHFVRIIKFGMKTKMFKKISSFNPILNH
jgi:hypothetical protein